MLKYRQSVQFAFKPDTGNLHKSTVQAKSDEGVVLVVFLGIDNYIKRESGDRTGQLYDMCE